MPLPPAPFKYVAELGAPSDEYNKSPCREGSPRLLKDKSRLPILHGDLLYSSLGAPSYVLDSGKIILSTLIAHFGKE